MDGQYTLEKVVTAMQFCAEKKDVLCEACAFHESGDSCRLVRNAAAVEFFKGMNQLVIKQDTLIRAFMEENRWIPATESDLPKEFVSVLVCIPSDDPLPTVKEAYLADGMWVTKAAYYTQQEVTHWRPMPKGVEVSADAQM